MPMYNLIEYSVNYSSTLGSLWPFGRDEINFWRSLEMLLINCKVELSLKWYERCLITAAITANFRVTDEKLYVPIVTLSIEDNSKLTKLLNERFKIPIYWNEYKVTPNKIVEIADANDVKYIKELLDSSCQGVKRLFVLAYNNTAGNDQVSVDSYEKYYLPTVKIDNYNIEIDGRNFYDQPINDSIKQYDEIRKISTGQGEGYTTGCLLDFSYFEKNYRLLAAGLSKQKALDADSRAIQQIIFTGTIKATVANRRTIIFYVIEKSKETILAFSKGTTKVL